MVSEKAIKDFEVYAKGVKRLEELEKELNSLDTRRFKRDASQIRKKLKSVHLIPQIEFDLRKLRAKISGIDLEYEKEKLDKSQNQKLTILEKRDSEIGKGIKLVKKRLLSDEDEKELEDIPKVKSRLDYVKRLLEGKSEKLEKEITRVRRTKLRKQLTREEVENVENIPTIEGKVGYLKTLLKRDSEKLEKLKEQEESMKSRLEFALKNVRKKQLTKKERENVNAIPSIRGRMNYLRSLLRTDSEQLQKLGDQEKRIKSKLDITSKQVHEKQLTDEEKENIDTLPKLKKSLSYLKSLFKKERDELEDLENSSEKIPHIQKRLDLISGLVGIKSEEIAKEAGDIERIKHKIYYLKKILENKAAELEKELQEKTKIPAKKKILHKIKELNEKIDRNREDLHKNLREEVSESKWMIEREKQELRDEINDIVAESRWLIDKGVQETDQHLYEEIEKFKQKFEQDKEELYEKFSSRVSKIKSELNELRSQNEAKHFEEKEKKKEKREVRSANELSISEDEKDRLLMKICDNEKFPQPFLPPPTFAPIKITTVKEEVKIPAKIETDKQLRKDKPFDFSEVPELPELPKMPELPLFLKIPQTARMSESFKPEIKLKTEPDIKAETKLQIPRLVLNKEDFKPDWTEERTEKLPKISQEKFTHEIKSAIELKRFSEPRKVLEIEVANKKQLHEEHKNLHEGIKKPFFIELEKFKEAENNLRTISIHTQNFEKTIKNSTEKNHKQEQYISNLINEMNAVKETLTNINNSLLNKVALN